MENTQSCTCLFLNGIEQRDEIPLFPGNEIQDLEKTLDRTGRNGTGAGPSITDEQIAELKAAADDINYDEAKEREKIVRHDVMSHVYAYGLQCPKAKGIIHWAQPPAMLAITRT